MGPAADPPANGAASARPPWLKPERFEDPAFNAEAVVADLRRHVPLNVAKGELQAYMLTLKEQLIEVLNQDFGDYVALAPRLGAVDGAVVRMKQPLLDIRAKLDAVRDGIVAELESLQQGLERRKEIAAARATLELMQEVAHVASKVEKLLSEVVAAAAPPGGGLLSVDGAEATAVPAGGGGDPDAHARLLERVAAEVSRLSFLSNKGKGLAFVATMERRIQAARLQLSSHLSAALAAAIAGKQWAAAGHCLRAYVELGDVPAGEATLRSALAAPLAADAVRAAKARLASEPGARGREVALVADAAIEGLHERAGPLLATLLAPGSGMGAFDVLGAVVLQEVTQALAEGLPGAFSPGNPASFHSNFLAGQRLLASLESLAQTRASVERLRASDAAAAFARRWNLPAYYSLQYQDIAGAFEAAAREPRLAAAAAAGAGEEGAPTLRLAVGAALWEALRRCTSDAVFLAPLGDRFLRLVCQLAARYASWARDAAAARREAAANPAAAAAAAAAMPPAPGAHGAPGSPMAPVAPAAVGPEAWAGGVATEELLSVCCDADSLQQLLQGPLLQRLRALMAGLPSEAGGRVDEAFARAAAQIGDASDEVLRAAAEEVADRCVAVVRQLKGITATYRMTSKGPPTRHSHYVSGVLAPLAAALDAAAASGAGAGAARGPPPPPRVSAALAAAVFDSVNARYRQLAEELLSGVRKTESSLKRLKKGRPGGADGGGGGDSAGSEMSDSEKICLQLFLDAQEHGRQAARFGINAAGAESFRALLAAVTPAAGGGSGGGAGTSGGGAAPGSPAAAAAQGAVPGVPAPAQQQQQPFQQQQQEPLNPPQQQQQQQQPQAPPPPGGAQW
ncbi:hypothetical protein Rsub_11374 [Raphidocelis subcapitata]|uniref:Conserved oligomeric Golgi complex subunit 2 n=1 Tax=Raphidocelis subcapitata TaxID=307507 RepID=A0A2V0PIC7_9CHLO|nr:hypothetical protein Rsub_11374 [Raphidocelis subcapitata]|eukprot:GBF98792.1 hypothetical protein Rsub_11374 [Raphidocelis subcapitata]